MTPKKRVEVALRGGTPDRVPTFPIYDFGYVMRSGGYDVREWVTSSSVDRIRYMEEAFLRHDVDGCFVHAGTSEKWVRNHRIEKLEDYWMITNVETGEQYRLLPDGWRAEADGTPILRHPSSGGVSKIRSRRDIEKQIKNPSTSKDFECSGFFLPIRYLAEKYPDHHFSFQSGTPMVKALRVCGGFVEGLTTLAEDRELFRDIMARCALENHARLEAAEKTGAHSTFFTCYHTGADTISPRDYAELVFPLERDICRAAKDRGFFVLNWFLGDLMPILDKVLELPIDALVLEQGRKGYEIDPVEIRKRAGPDFCLFGFGYERAYCDFDRRDLTEELERQLHGTGRDGAFIAGTPIMPPDAQPEAVDWYFREARRIGVYPLEDSRIDGGTEGGGMRRITRTRLTDDLRALGIREGDSVMLHSSLSSLGFVNGGAETVVEAFMDALGSEGTLLTPAFTEGAWTDRLAMEDCEGNCPQEFCPSRSPSHEGAIPNAALNREGRLRSCHPTHSWVANGGRAAEAVKDHRHCPTICGRGNPFEKVVEWDGCIIILGVDVGRITLWHYYEDILGVPYLGYYHPKERHLSYCTSGRRIQYEFPGIMQEVVRASGIMQTGKVGRSTSHLIRTREFRGFMETIAADDPYCFVVRPPDRHSGNLAVDALRKGAAMLRAWEDGPLELPERIDWPDGEDDDTVREDCPAFAGYHRAGDREWPLCRANGRHPDLFHHGGVFDTWGRTSCGRCPWHRRYPRTY